tara:strand:+ start:270 stop:878 length:609 start_codon:yes stop_codon:yes gene_type:complete
MADPTYIVDGVLTQPEPWVCIQSTTTANDTTDTITWTSSTGQNNWSQYMDFAILIYCQNTYDGPNWGDVKIQLNNNTTSNTYGNQDMSQATTGSTVAASAQGSFRSNYYLGYGPANEDGSSNYFGAIVAYIWDVNSGKAKTCISQHGGTSSGASTGLTGYVSVEGNVMYKQEPITEIDILTGGYYFRSGSRFDLYGILPKMD